MVRVACAIALSGALLVAAGCSDSTAPEAAANTPPAVPAVDPAVTASLAAVGGSLDDMTLGALSGLSNETGKAALGGALASLRTQLVGGSVALSRQGLAEARSVMSTLTELEQVEAGQIAIALDLVQVTLDAVK
jgi:hypothetical protein